MRSFFYRFTIYLSFLTATQFARANVSLHFPNLLYDTTVYSMDEFILGRNCFSIPSSTMGLSCNPAALADEEKEGLHTHLLATDSMSEVIRYAELLRDDDTLGVVRRSLEKDGPIYSQAAWPIWYQREWWAVAVTPARIGVASDVRNPVIPEMNIHASLETEVVAKLGLFSSADHNLKVGSSLRYVDAKILRDYFEVLAASIGSHDFEIQESKAVFIEPGLSYTFDSSWDATVSAVVTHIPVYEYGEDLPVSPALELGYLTVPDFLNKKFKSSVHLTTRRDVKYMEDRVSWGGRFDFSRQLALSFVLSTREQGIGLQGHIDSVVLGIGYKSQDLYFNGYEIERVSTALFQLGLQF